MKDVLVRLATIGLIIAALFIYNNRTNEHLKADAMQKAKIDSQNAQIEAENQKILAQQAASGEIKPKYAAGTYHGSAQGFGGMIEVTVTVDEFQIKSIEVVSAPGEDGAYFSTASAIIDDVLEAQTSNVDTISGATFSSTGIKNAITYALKEAKSE